MVEAVWQRLRDPQRTFIIAEAGVNHNGRLDLARALVDGAAAAGVDAVKFQTFTAEGLVTREAPKAGYQLETTPAGESQYEMLRRLELSPEAHRELSAYCYGKGLLFLSTPFDEAGADLLEALNVPLYKIGSGEITNTPFLKYVARKGKPILLSTGMSYQAEVERAVAVIRGSGNNRLALLHCVSSYPAEPGEVNLRAMQTMQRAFQLPVGYSDHTLGIEICLAAVALGATLIEKHVTLERGLPGPDHRASLEMKDLSRLVQGIRAVESSLGHGRKEPAERESRTAQVVRKSLVAARNLPTGTRLTAEMISVKRPGTGLDPEKRSLLIGRCLRVPVQTGDLLSLEMVA